LLLLLILQEIIYIDVEDVDVDDEEIENVNADDGAVSDGGQLRLELDESRQQLERCLSELDASREQLDASQKALESCMFELEAYRKAVDFFTQGWDEEKMALLKQIQHLQQQLSSKRN
jgi:chromosome segregation ATPase